MAYIGTKPTVGNFQICDAISVVNGQAAYTMQVGSVNVIPQSANHMIVSLNGTIQKPNSSFTVSGSTITFASNLATGDVIDFIQILGDVLDLGVPSDATVTTAKLASDSVTYEKIGYNANQYRNIIINGDMSISQRGTSATGLTNGNSGYHTVDRFQWSESGSPSAVFTQTQSTDVPTGQGFAKSLKMDCTTAQGSLGSGDLLKIRTTFEGQNLQYLKKGTSSAESLTMSFWVKSSKTGTYICQLLDKDNSRSISKSYTISSADTWEKKTITYDGDTTGGFTNDNGSSLQCIWWLGAGSGSSSGTLQTSWGATTTADTAVGQVNLADSTSNEWYVTGIQLEAGTSASDFEFLPFDINKRRCERYYMNLGLCTGSAYSSTNGMIWSIQFPVETRATPTVSFSYSGTANRIYRIENGATSDFTSPTIFKTTKGIQQMYSSGTPASGWANTEGRGFLSSWVIESEL